jgi:hypothetical protein
MHLLPPSPKPFGVFAEKSEVPLSDWEIEQQLALEVEKNIHAAFWHAAFDQVVKDLHKHGWAYYSSPFPMKYIHLKTELSNGQPDR